MSKYSGRTLVKGNEEHSVCPVIASDVGLSFWGGIDEKTGIVIDHSHPLYGQSVAGSILCLPSGRGSCTASQVMLELILNGKAPKALILRDRDGLVSVGALVAQAIFPDSDVLDIIQIENYQALLEQKPSFGRVLNHGSLIFGESVEEIEEAFEPNPKDTADPTKGGDLVLTDEEQEMMDACQTEAERRALECIIKYAYIVSDSPKYIDVGKAHIDGCTYIGPGGLAFAERLVQEGGKVKVPTTLNSVSTDLRNWKNLGIEATESQQSSMKLAEAYVALGCSERSFTCAPYLLENPPELDEQIVWGESNAVVFANSILGARTEKYADYLDICCAIVGKVPEVGVHIKEKRQPKILLDVSAIDFSTDDSASFSLLFPVLGHLCGTLSDGEVPLLVGLERYSKDITSDHLKDFCAAFGTTAASPLIHVAGVTPEVTDEMIASCKKKYTVDVLELEETYKLLDQHNALDTDEEGSIDWISLGNPHLSLSECEKLLEKIQSLPSPQKKKAEVEVIACMSRELYDKSPAVPALRDFGISFVNDTCWCMLLQPPMIPTNPEATILTNSGKYAHYGPGLTERKFRLASMAECVDAAVTGKLSRRSTHPWSKQTRSYSTFAKRHDRTSHCCSKTSPRNSIHTELARRLLIGFKK
ncbi:unnamed protein product [Cylindrotheca closterium]|uniref:Aconitase X catalytic domain-containing protein n=1 Tax=Cylindrotheca closterium TaxID=2856 RepID=A0AAD2CCC1_9STRA|nr:unnamed protein product [Cylindrotheca closterium]